MRLCFFPFATYFARIFDRLVPEKPLPEVEEDNDFATRVISMKSKEFRKNWGRLIQKIYLPLIKIQPQVYPADSNLPKCSIPPQKINIDNKVRFRYPDEYCFRKIIPDVVLIDCGTLPFLVFDIKPYSSIITRRLICHENNQSIGQFDAAIPF